MRRVHLFEIEDQPWCPPAIRDAATDFLQFALHVGNNYALIAPRLRRALARAGAERIVDLGSGGGGPWLKLLGELDRHGPPLEVLLTDRYPNREALERARELSGGRLDFHPDPVDATATPGELAGFRTLFTSFHHFHPEAARTLLRDAVRNRQGIGVFEARQRTPKALLLTALSPLFVLLSTPFIRPFRLSRLLFTYLLPVVPLVVLFDGIVSCLRTYTPAELREMAESLGGEDYLWEIGEEKARGPAPVTNLIGYLAEERPLLPGDRSSAAAQ